MFYLLITIQKTLSDVILKPAETCLRLGEEYVPGIILQLLYNQIVSYLIAKWAFSRRKIGTFTSQSHAFWKSESFL